MALVAEVEEELAAIGLDALLRFGEVIDLEAEMMRADEGRALLEIGRLAAGLPLKIEQREIDHAVSHLERGTAVDVLADVAVVPERARLQRRPEHPSLDEDRKEAQTS